MIKRLSISQKGISWVWDDWPFILEKNDVISSSFTRHYETYFRATGHHASSILKSAASHILILF